MTLKKSIACLSLLLLLITYSCGNNKGVTKQVTKKINDKELRERLFNLQNIDYHFFYTKMNVNYKNSKKEQSFKMSVKMKVDSAFSGTISYANFIVATYLVDKDSLKSTNKQEKCYFTEDLSYISSMIGVELEYDFFEDLLLGKPIKIDGKSKYKQIKDKNKQYYILSSHNKHKFKKIEEDKINLDNDKNDNIYIQYYFTPNSLNLAKMHIEIPADSVSININYVETKLVAGVTVPELTTMTIVHPKDSIIVQLDYSKVRLNQRKTIKFSVPNNYEDCNK